MLMLMREYVFPSMSMSKSKRTKIRALAVT